MLSQNGLVGWPFGRQNKLLDFSDIQVDIFSFPGHQRIIISLLDKSQLALFNKLLHTKIARASRINSLSMKTSENEAVNKMKYFAHQRKQLRHINWTRVPQLLNCNQQLLLSRIKMEPELNNLQVHACSAFRRTVQPQALINQALAQLEAYVQQALNMKKKILLLQAVDYFETTHPLTHVLIDLVFSLQNSLANESENPNTGSSTQKITQIPMSLFKSICTLIQESLVVINCKYGCQLTLSMLFERGLVQTFKLCFFQNNSHSNKQGYKLSYAALDQVLVNLGGQDYRQQFLKNVYTLHSGSPILIQRTSFTQNLKCVINNIGKTFTEKTNLITRNLKNVKKSKFINEIVSNSIKTICNYKNQQFIQEEVKRVTNAIFGADCLSLSKELFFQKVSSLLAASNSNKQGPNVLYTVFLYVDLFRVETLMINDPELAVNIQKQKEINSSNFYTQEMQKLLKKCPYNGDECCDCKKCQCVRRNRQSAKLSQQKKRNAVEQLDPMKRRIDELERRNRQLEEENKILRGIVKQLKSYEGIKSAFNSTIESVSKVLDD